MQHLLSCGLALSLSFVACSPQKVKRMIKGQPPVEQVQTTDTNAKPPSERWIMPYYTAYEQDSLPVEKIDFSLMTHIAIARIVPNADGSIDTSMDGHESSGVLAKLTKAAHEADKKVIVMVGGAGAVDGWVGATQAGNIGRFVEALVAFAHVNHVDGLDLDWEPIKKETEPVLLDVAKRIRAVDPKLLLTFPAEWAHGFQPETIRALAERFDRVNIMSYEMAGPWGGIGGWDVWHSGALYGHTDKTPSSVDFSVAQFLKSEFPREKLGIGIGAYGQCWAGGAARPHGSIEGLHIESNDHKMPYRRVSEEFVPKGKREWDAEARVPFLTFDTPTGAEGCRMMSYEDPESAREKGAYLASRQLGGAIMWTLSQSYVPSAAKPFPLLSALREGWSAAKP